MRPSVGETVEFQKRLGLRDVHVVYLDETGFTIAHTDHERETIPLVECPLHRWLTEQGGRPVAESGFYMALPHYADAYSEPWGMLPWEFEKMPETKDNGE